MLEKIIQMKKIELHLHLDGSMSLELASKLSGASCEECKKMMVASDFVRDLRDYLINFNFPISLMQTKENLKLVASDLVNRLEKENVIYAEIRFAPVSHINEGLTYDEIVESVLEGLRENKNVKTNLILCMRRGFPDELNIETLKTAKKYLNKGVVAVDLVGDEKNHKLKEHLSLFSLVRDMNVPFTIHAGETDEIDILDAINLGVKRIGHGVQCINNQELIDLIKEKNILLEVCPTSNIQTNAFSDYTNHPVYKLYKENINISINTDNMTVSNIDLNEEYLKLINNFPFSIDDLKEINRNSVNYAFLSPKEKIELLEKLK